MKEISILFYASGDLKELTNFLDAVLRLNLLRYEVLIYVDNNDNIICPFLNKLKFKYGKRINLRFFINPPKPDKNGVYEFLKSKCNYKNIVNTLKSLNDLIHEN
jgi:hypothetical protein